MFERFTDDSRAVVARAVELAVTQGSDEITAAHLLYGCAAGRDTTAGEPLREAGITSAAVRQLLVPGDRTGPPQLDEEALRAIGIAYDDVRTAVEETFGPGALDNAPDRRISIKTRRRKRFAPDAKRTLELSVRVVQELHQRQLLPGHLLLGLLRLNDPLVSKVIDESGTSVAALSAAVLARVSVA